jgi:hypothetical protein
VYGASSTQLADWTEINANFTQNRFKEQTAWGSEREWQEDLDVHCCGVDWVLG